LGPCYKVHHTPRWSGGTGVHCEQTPTRCHWSGSGVFTASAQAVDARDEACLVQAAVTTLSGDASRAISNLRGELADAKSEREALESTVLTLSATVTALMDQAGLGSAGGITQSSLDQCFRLHDKAVSRRLDTRSGGSGSPGGRRLWTGPASTSPQTPTSASGE
jgi:hypothetical protein